MKLISALAICFGLAWGAAATGLAPIVGAFAAGLVVKEAFFSDFERERTLREHLEPLSSFFVPVFFVLMGIDVDLRAMADVKALGLAAALTFAAVAGKQACGLAVLERGVDRLSVGVGMVPRGEVGLIFAGIGRSLGVVSDALYGACITMVIASTFVAPLVLPYTMRRFERRRAKSARAPVSAGGGAGPG
jgi:Na+:H+ antiporter